MIGLGTIWSVSPTVENFFAHNMTDKRPTTSKDSISSGADIESGSEDEGLHGVYGERLHIIQKEANLLLERLSVEFETIKSRINARAEEELSRVSETVYRNRDIAMDMLEREFVQKRDSINLVAKQQIQYTYRMAHGDRSRRSISADTLIQPSPKNSRPKLPFGSAYRIQQSSQSSLMDVPQIYLPCINAVIDFPRIYMKPYDTPAVNPVPVRAFPETYGPSNPSI